MPNSTAVSQETEDGNHGPTKTGFHSNLKELLDERTTADVSVSFAPRLVDLVLFGGRDDMTGHVLKRNAYEDSFNQESNLRHWAKVGAAEVGSSYFSRKKHLPMKKNTPPTKH